MVLEVNLTCRDSIVEVSGSNSNLHKHNSNQFRGGASIIVSR